MSNDELKDMLNFLEGQGLFAGQVKNSGLIIRERSSVVEFEELAHEISRARAIGSLCYDGSQDDTEFIAALEGCVAEGRWPLINISKDPSQEVIAAIRTLAEELPHRKISHAAGSGNVNLLVFADRKFIETQVSYPYFYGLFGPVCAV